MMAYFCAKAIRGELNASGLCSDLFVYSGASIKEDIFN